MNKVFLKSSQKHAKKACANMMHVRLFHGIAWQVYGACKGQPNQTKPKQSHDMVKHHQKHAEMGRKQTRLTCQGMKHIKLV